MTQVAIITTKEIESASSVLATTKGWVERYQKKHDSLLKKAEVNGDKLTPELDQEINDFLVSLRSAAKSAEDSRKPFTSKMDEIKKLFTKEESALKTTLSEKLQAKRDASARIYAREAAEKASVDQLKLDQAKARIELFAEAEAQIRIQYANRLQQDKQELLNAFDHATLETIDTLGDVLASVVGTFERSVWDNFKADVSNTLVYPMASKIPSELSDIAEKAKEGKFEKVAPHYQSEIKSYADHLLTLLPQRKEELEQGKASEAAEALKKQQEDEAKAIQIANQQKHDLQVKSQVGAAVIDVQIDQANRGLTIPKGQTIQGYAIEVLEQAGWAEIFKFFMSQGQEITEKTTIGSMKLFAERVAKSTGETITSEYLHYEPTYKAVTKAKKAA